MAQCPRCNNQLQPLDEGREPVCPHCAMTSLWEMDEDEPTSKPEDYDIQRELGHGGDGTVYLCRDLKVGRQVAIKFVNSLRSSESAATRFRAEIEAIASLDHPHIIPIYTNGEMSGRSFYTMKYVSGGSLADRRGQSTPPREAVTLMRKIASAVQHAHERGILHRDLKPSNILLDERGEPYLSDFGLAKRPDSTADLTLTGSVMGTPAYMSPEQARGENASLTPASDIFSLGGLLYFLLHGEHAFDGPNPPAILRSVLEDETRFPKNFDRDLTAICQKCLEKKPTDRYPSTKLLVDDLSAWENGAPVSARHLTLSRRVGRIAKRHPLSIIATLLGLTLLSVLIFKDSPIPPETAITENEADYLARLDQSLVVLRRNDYAEANRLLDRVPASLRGFEWTVAKSLACGDAIQTSEPIPQIIPAIPLWEIAFATDHLTVSRPDQQPTFTFPLADPLQLSQLSHDSRHLIILTGEKNTRVQVRDLTSGKLTLDQSLPWPAKTIPCQDSDALILYGDFPYLLTWNYQAATLHRSYSPIPCEHHFVRTAPGNSGLYHFADIASTDALISLPNDSGYISRHGGTTLRWPLSRKLPGQDDDFSTGASDTPPAISHNGRFVFFQNLHQQPELRDLHSSQAHLSPYFRSRLAVFDDGSYLTLEHPTGVITCWQINESGIVEWRWNFQTDLPIQPSGRVIKSAVTPDELFAATLLPNGHLLIDLSRQEASFTPSPEIGSDISISPDGKTIVTCGIKTTLYEESRTTKIPTENQFQHCHFTPNGSQLLLADNTGLLQSLHPKKLSQLWSTQTSGITALTTTPDSQHLLLGTDSAIQIRTLAEPAKVRLTIPTASSPSHLQLCDSHLFHVNQIGTIEFLRLNSP